MEPMFLPEIENNQQPSAWADSIGLMQQTGAEYPQIWRLFAYKPEMTAHLARFTQEALRDPAPLSPGCGN